MSRLLTTTALLALLASGAHAAEMPKELQGSWCKTATTKTTTSYQWTPEGCPPEQDEISIDRKGFRVFLPDINCRLRKRAGNRLTFSCEGGPAMELIWTRKRDALTLIH